MTIDERSRHELYRKLEQLLGSEEADTLMAHLPPVGWADVVTNHTLDIKLDALRHEVRAEIASVKWQVVTAVLASNLTLAGLAFAAAKLV